MTRLLCVFATVFLLFFAGGCGEDRPEPAPTNSAETGSEEAAGEKPVGEQSQPEPGPGPGGSGTAREAENGNKPPVVESVRLEPIDAVPGSEIVAQVEAHDPEGDPVMLEYTWYRNDEEVRGQVFERLSTEGFDKGDLIWVEVVGYDGRERGKAVESAPVLLHNRPPEITSYPPGGLEDGRYTYQVEAKDPDGDSLEYSLEGAPEGMEIDSDSGLLTWDVPEDQSGGFQVRITASDGDAKAYQSFSMKVSPEDQ